MKRVAVLYSGGRQWGGIETYLANLLRLHDPTQIYPVLVSLGEWELTRALEQNGLASLVRILSSKRMRLRTVFDIRRMITTEHLGLVVSHGTVANAYARLAALLAHVPSLVVVHSDMTLDYPRSKRLAYVLSDRALRAATTRYVAVSHDLKEKLVKSGIKAERVNVIYNGVGVAGGIPRRALATATKSVAGQGAGRPAARADERSEATTMLASVGRLHPVKNFDGLIKAMLVLPGNVYLTIWGDGPEKARLAALIEKLGLGDRVVLAGESQNMEEALEGVAVYVQPSKSEGWGFTVGEAMLHGMPVVVTPRGGLPEQVDHGVTGVVAEDCSPEALAKAIMSLVADPERATRLGAAGREAAEAKFPMQKWLRDTTSVFCDTARGDASPQ